MLKRYLAVAGFAVTIAAILAIPASKAAGYWDNWPQVGQSSFCATYATTSAGQTCVLSIPAGPSVFTGFEYFPADVNQAGTAGSQSGGAQSATINIQQLGQGPMVDITSPASATIPAQMPWYFLDGAQASAFTITMPAVAIEGQIQHVVCEAATVGALTVAANSNQTLKGNPSAACVAGTTYNWRYQSSNSTWYRF